MSKWLGLVCALAACTPSGNTDGIDAAASESGYTLLTRDPAAPPGDPLVKNACAIVSSASAVISFGGTCASSQSACQQNSDCADNTCLLGEAPVPDSVFQAFHNLGFQFGGKDIPGIWLGQGGYLVFSDSRPNKTRAQVGLATTLDMDTTPTPGVMAFWDNLEPNTACAALTSDDGTLWLTWRACFADTGCAASDDLEFTVALESGTNLIRVGYLGMTSPTDPLAAAGSMASVGVRYAATAGCAADLCGLDGQCTDGSGACGYTQAFARTQQTSPTLVQENFVFTPND